MPTDGTETGGCEGAFKWGGSILRGLQCELSQVDRKMERRFVVGMVHVVNKTKLELPLRNVDVK